jgi:hypothetical protein
MEEAALASYRRGSCEDAGAGGIVAAHDDTYDACGGEHRRIVAAGYISARRFAGGAMEALRYE